MRTAIGQNHESRLRWCRVVMGERRDVMGVQTLRNQMMSSSLLSTISITVIALVAAYLVNLRDSQLPDLSLAPPNFIPLGYKMFVVIICFVVAFFCFMQSLRAYNHGSYLIGLPIDVNYYVTADYVCEILNRGADYYTIGTRFFYLALISLVWLFGSIPAAIVVIFIVPLLHRSDMAPHPHTRKRAISG